MRRFLSLPLLFIALAAGAAAAGEPARPPQPPRPHESSCVNCHSQLDGAALEPTRHIGDDIHFLKGLSCHDCHGGDPAAGLEGDPDAAHDVKKGWTGKPAHKGIPGFCGRCHSDASFMKKFNPRARVDQLSEYRTSVHGKRNAEGDDRAAVCTDCHQVHGIRAVGDPRSSVYPTRVAATCARCHADEARMGRYLVPTSQYAEYKTSVHARALYDKGDISSPTCNDCHGSHGAVPPGVENVANVCGTCHGREATLFRDTEAKRQMDLSACIQCLVCHGNHAVLPPTDEMLGVGSKSTCTGCHVTGEPGYAAAVRMADSVERLKGKIAKARTLLDSAERAGMEVSEDRFALQKAQDSLVEARVLAHSFDLKRFLAAADPGIAVADAGIAAGHRVFGELRYRRTGLALSLVVIVAVIVALVLKAREIRRQSPL